MKILIVGAGFGGLALAAYLQRDGHAVTIIEKQQNHPQAGFIIGLWSNGLHTLEPFGVVEHLHRIGLPVAKEYIRDRAGSVIATIDYQPLIEKYGDVLLLRHAQLLEVLRTLTENVPIRFGYMISKLEEVAQGVLVTFSKEVEERFDLVVGADGVHSQVRKLLFADEGFSPSGLNIWCAMLPAGKEAISEPNDLFGEGEYVGVFPTKDGQVGVLFLATANGQKPVAPQQRITFLRERFGDFGWIIPDILQSLHDPAKIFSEEIDLVSLAAWSQGRVALLGDAAHAVSPTAAMGGAMALEDAHVLAEELRLVDATRIEEALSNYATRRKPRVAEVHHSSDFLIWIASMHHPAMTTLRNAVIHLLPSSFLLQGMEPILKTQA